MSLLRDLGELGKADPRWVDAILDWRWTWLVARTALIGAYLIGGVAKLFDFNAAVVQQQQIGIGPAVLWVTLTIFVEIVGPILIISGRYVWLGAGALGVFTALSIIVNDNFWTMQGQARFIAVNTFLEHIGLIAGLVMAALITEHARRDGRP